jgi:stress response protein SCP2
MFVGKDTIYVKTYESLLKRKSQSFTELYFEDYSQLPKKVSSNGELDFTFFIHNKEGKTTTYPYYVYFESIRGKKVGLASGSAQLSDEESKSIKVNYIFPDSNQTGRIVVELTNLNQKIDFLIPRNK